MKSWFVAKTKPAKEWYVETCLSEKWDIEVFRPMIHRPTGGKSAFEPLFPGYLFCRIDMNSGAWPAVRWAPGLCYFLGAGEQVTAVSDRLIEFIRQKVAWWNQGGYIHCFSPGEKVIVTRYPVSEVEGIFDRYLPSRQRCQVLLNLLGQKNKVELPVEALKAKQHQFKLAAATGISGF